MRHEDLQQTYQLPTEGLENLSEHIQHFLQSKGVTIFCKNLQTINDNVDDEKKGTRLSHFQSCISDGQHIWLHDNLAHVGGICGRLYDILHVGCGHLWQWNADVFSGLQFYGDYAWEVGGRSFRGASEEEINIAMQYESEAGRLAMANLMTILQLYRMPVEFSLAVLRFFNDYIHHDFNYIISFYKTGEVKYFFDHWEYDVPAKLSISNNFPLHIIQRDSTSQALLAMR